mmetsp:Transcript_127593/g.272033  ORF Transcript_127593/g.272033 Transcript_127593/m.272033 type:complete len:271 (-) Transcript_127593:1630-2442(-)
MLLAMPPLAFVLGPIGVAVDAIAVHLADLPLALVARAIWPDLDAAAVLVVAHPLAGEGGAAGCLHRRPPLWRTFFRCELPAPQLEDTLPARLVGFQGLLQHGLGARLQLAEAGAELACAQRHLLHEGVRHILQDDGGGGRPGRQLLHGLSRETFLNSRRDLDDLWHGSLLPLLALSLLFIPLLILDHWRHLVQVKTELLSSSNFSSHRGGLCLLRISSGLLLSSGSLCSLGLSRPHYCLRSRLRCRFRCSLCVRLLLESISPAPDALVVE